MANASGAFGLRPINLAGGAANSTGTTAYFIASDASAIYQGSPVIATNDGTIAITGSASGDTYKHVGSFGGCEYVSTATGKKTWANSWPGSGANTNFDIVGYVYDNPMQKFVIATDATSTNRATAKALVWESCAFVTATSGTSSTGNSSATLGVSTADNTDLSLPLKVLGIYEDPTTQDFAAAGVQLVVMFNNHALLSANSEGTVA
tara:strand:+ start:2275 stop:2892 length:618 start_codon:yes stop_codon:yes gene_type:complete